MLILIQKLLNMQLVPVLWYIGQAADLKGIMKYRRPLSPCTHVYSLSKLATQLILD